MIGRRSRDRSVQKRSVGRQADRMRHSALLKHIFTRGATLDEEASTLPRIAARRGTSI